MVRSWKPIEGIVDFDTINEVREEREGLEPAWPRLRVNHSLPIGVRPPGGTNSDHTSQKSGAIPRYRKPRSSAAINSDRILSVKAA
jgi:hypothetical protein